MKRLQGLARLFIAASLSVPLVVGQQPFPVISTVDESTIAGRPVALDSDGKLLPWPMPDSTGYSYSAYFLSQWTIVWDQYNRQRLPYFYCCFDFDRTTFELKPDPTWVNSTGYLRAMMQGFIERLYPYTGDPHTLEFLQNFVDYELENGLTPEGYAWSAGTLSVGKPRCPAIHRLEPAWGRLCGTPCGRRRRLCLSPALRNDGEHEVPACRDSLRRRAREELSSPAMKTIRRGRIDVMRATAV